MWLSNNVGAASFWTEKDSLERYKHASGQKTFKAIADDAQSAVSKPELCASLLQATYVREYVVPQDMSKAPTPMTDLSEAAQRELLRLLP